MEWDELIHASEGVEKTILGVKQCYERNENELWRGHYTSLLKTLEELGDRRSPSVWDQPERNYEYIFTEITYIFDESVGLFLDVENAQDLDTPPYRRYLRPNQVEKLISLSEAISQYEDTSYHEVLRLYSSELVKKIQDRFHAKKPDSIFPYMGVNKMISLDPAWDKIRKLAVSTWEAFVSEGLFTP